MKLSALFAKYLYQHKELNLPGIGVFTIDPTIAVPELSEKTHSDFIQQIKFIQKPITRPDDAFIDFIRTQTGKIRPLAESDLDSFLSDGKILLNIGKPFYFEGIGSIQKNKQGTYDFIPGSPLIDKLEAYNPEKNYGKSSDQRPITREDYQPQSNSLRKVILALAIVVGLIAVIWGGYVMYNRSGSANEEAYVVDSSSFILPEPAGDSLSLNPLTNTSPEGEYKFIIETTPSKARALRRYNQLKSFRLDIKMDTPADSSFFKLYFQIPAQPKDTIRIKDSLKRMYNTKKVLVEL